MSRKEIELIDKAVLELKPLGIIDKVPLTEKGMGFVMMYLEHNSGKAYTNDLAKEMNCSTASVSKIINKLEKKNYVKRSKSEDDSRKTEIIITTQGIKHNKEMKESKDKFIEHLLSKISVEELLDFINEASKIKKIIADEAMGKGNNV